MKVHLVNTANGFLIPETDIDGDLKKQLRIGETYSADIKLVRNAEFHRKYFKMIHTAFEFLPDRQRRFFKDQETFRKFLEVTAGYYEPFFSPKLCEWIQVPKSVAYDKLDQAGMEALYNTVRKVLDEMLTQWISREDFEKYFLPF